MNGDVYREAAPYYVEVWLKYLMHMKLYRFTLSPSHIMLPFVTFYCCPLQQVLGGGLLSKKVWTCRRFSAA